MTKVELYGYTIYDDGTILKKNGKKLNTNQQIKIKLDNNGNTRQVNYARFVYYAFNRDFDINDKNIMIKHINGNKQDCRIDNLLSQSVKLIKQGENSTSAKLTDKEVEEIKRLYGLKDNEGTNSPKTNISYRKLAERYGVTHTAIRGIIKGYFRNKDKYIIK